MAETLSKNAVTIEGLIGDARVRFSKREFMDPTSTGQVFPYDPDDAIHDTVESLKLSGFDLLNIVLREATVQPTAIEIDDVRSRPEITTMEHFARMVAECILYAEYLRSAPSIQEEVMDRYARSRQIEDRLSRRVLTKPQAQ